MQVSPDVRTAYESLSKSKIKTIKSLQIKKFREANNLFVAEGAKLVGEIIQSQLEVVVVVASEAWIVKNQKILRPDIEIIETSITTIASLSTLANQQEVIALVKIPTYPLDLDLIRNKLTLFLDQVQDPGNMGTILRIADWFGIDTVMCSLGTVDLYNPKTVQATMGAICRVKVSYVDADFLFASLPDVPVYGTFLNGESIYNSELTTNGIIVMGNESNGIAKHLHPYITTRLFIPGFPADSFSSESLNVATATAIVCYEFRRQNR